LWDFLGTDLLALGAIEIISFHFDKINDSFKTVFKTDVNLYRSCVEIETITDSCNSFPRVGAKSIEFVDKNKAGNFVAFHLLVYS
jgi:hypothetical protein